MNYFLSHHLDRDGYGYAGLKILQALGRVARGEWRGVDMCADGGRARPGEREWVVERTAVVMTTPEWWPDVRAERLIGFTMFESTRMPEKRVELINEHAAACLVPCEWCRRVFEEQGVRVPVRVARWGVDQADYWFLDRSDHEGPYTFLWSGTPDFRKGWDLVYKAFWAAFGGSDAARLVLHFREMPRGVRGVGDRNVRFVVGYLGRREMRRLFQDADCFVFPSRGEGWGLPPREAAATGLPVIATEWGGLAEEISDWAVCPLRVRELRPAAFGFWNAGEIGEWAEPEFEHLVTLMRWCAENREAAVKMGEMKATWMASEGTWERTARGIRDWVLGIGPSTSSG
jgi:glycosyltransferase involved in cell wall biosynthesis